MTDQNRPFFTNCLILLAIYYFLIPAPAMAYFDLSTGTYLIQMVLGLGAAAWLSMRTSWIRFGKKKKPATEKAAAAATPDVPAEAAAEAKPTDA